MGTMMLPLADGTHRSPVRTHCAAPSGAARQCPGAEPASAQRHPACGRTRPRTARAARSVRQLVHHPHADEPLAGERRPGPGLRAAATRAGRADQARGGADGRRRCQGASRRNGVPRKTAPNRSGARAAAGPPGFMWLPRMPGPPSRSRSRRDRPATPGRAQAAEPAWQAGRRPAAGRGPRARRQRDPPIGLGLGACAGAAALACARRALGAQPRYVQATRRIERLLRRLKGFRRIFTRLGKPGVALLGFILFALIVDAVR